MPRRAQGSTPASIRKLHDALGELACDVCGSFLMDPEGREIYLASRTPARMRKAAKRTAPEPLDTWDMEDGGKIVLIPSPLENHFAVVAEHPDFKALAAIEYDVDSDEPAPVAVMAFEGDERKALKHVRAWIEELDMEDDWDNPFDLPIPDDLMDLFSAPMPRIKSPLPHDAVSRVISIATRAANKFRKTQRFDPTQADMEWLEEHPDSLLVTLNGYIAACSASPRDEMLIVAHRQMLLVQLEFIRFSLEQKWDWAAELVKSYEARIVALAGDKSLEPDDWYFLPTTFSRARVPLSEQAAAAFAAAGAAIAPEIASEDMPRMMRELVDQISAEVRDPFEISEILQELTSALPAMGRAYIVHELALASNPLARAAVPMLLLDQEAEVRQAAIAALEQTAVPDTMADQSLRRVIAVRNWLPTAERPALDRVIRKAREKGVAIAPWPKGEDVAINVSIIDGVGAQSILLTSRTGRVGLFAMLLLKRGVRDTACVPDEKRRDIKSHLELLRESAQAVEVEREYLGLAVQHAIATGLAGGTVPPVGLLNIAERIGAADWKDRAVDSAEDIAGLFAELDPTDCTRAAIEASLRRSDTWSRFDDVFGSWFDDGSEVHDVMARAPRGKRAATVQFVLDEVLEKLRAPWVEQLLLLTHWARSAKDAAVHARWKDFLILAHCLSSGWKLADIPLMRTAAETTLAVARGQKIMGGGRRR